MPDLPPPSASASPSTKQTKPNSTDHITISNVQSRNQRYGDLESPNFLTTQYSRLSTTLRQPRVRRTNPAVWFAAVLCFIFSVVLIFFGIATLIIFLTIKPRNPTFDIPNASLNVVYFDSPEYLNGDFVLLVNFSNPNRKIHVKFQSGNIQLFFSDRVISSQAIQPFTQRGRETRLQSIHFISSLVFLPQDLGIKLQRQVQSNKVNCIVRATFRVSAIVGFIHMSFWIHSTCQIEMTGPPGGVEVTRTCITKR
ncbi:hypothetical protein QN277_016117 [Acacia crassicarpa]|uniref:Late embryogenesis abundant protein LEA-2 subgroup domain-containing protein n=1 Tax=Acacia crassicarpa TaxID=499986 RepID=A0AAE1MVZ7_9FABA|nr:hypothetical protein QN277_016117 [Acacia crassicarpa]